jgi:type IV pilus assembly protein PilQ
VVLEKAKPDEMKKTLDTIALSYPDGQSISVAANPSTSVVVLVGPDERVQELEQIARQLDIAEPVIPTVTRAVKLNYAEPQGVRTVIEGILTKDIGVVEEDERGRHIVITDTPLVVEQIEALIKELDTPVKQVAIDAMIVDAVMRDSSQTGVDWLMERIPGRNRRGEVIGNLQELALDAKLGNIGSDLLDAGVLSIGTLSRDWNFRANLAAEVQSRNAEILANPVIVTVENKPAQIQIVQEYPYQELTQSTEGGSVASTEFKPIGVTLEVTPRVTHENDIIVDVKTKQSSISGLSETGVPIEDKRQASTTLLTGNGRTIFIGGLRNVSDRLDISKLPVLGDIPIAKFLFSQNDIEKVNTELLVFMTCNVVEKELPELSPEQRMRHDKLDTVPEVPDSQRALFRSITHPEEVRDPAWKWRRKK